MTETTGTAETTETTEARGYHHGELREAVLTCAMAMLEAGEAFSMRAVARRVGVSATAIYRHFADREAVESALAGQGFSALTAHLLARVPSPATTAELAELGVGYVRFALARPALFRLMFGGACDTTLPERVAAAATIRSLLAAAMQRVAPPHADVDALATAGWALAHGLAALHLDGKLPAHDLEDVDARVRAAILAILTTPLPAPPNTPPSQEPG